MKLRCPYCKAALAAADAITCPSCHRTMRVPESLLPPEARAQRLADRRKRHAVARGRRTVGVYEPIGGRPHWQLAAAIGILLIVGGLVVLGSRSTFVTADTYRTRQATKELNVLRVALEFYRRDCARFPSTAEGIPALFRDPGAAGWQGPYITNLRADPWQEPYRYASVSNAAHLLSCGPDRRPGTPDDLAPTDWAKLLIAP